MADEIAEWEEKPHFAGLLGIEWLDDDPAASRARLDVREELLQPFGIVHGGVLSTLVESVCSRATALAVYEDGMVAMGQSINVSFVRPISAGSIEVLATARHRGRTTWVWEAEVRDENGRTCSISQMTIAVRPMPKGA
jgi:1,4-dihydroxy-2-naphthoyl-CoA hydrolase